MLLSCGLGCLYIQVVTVRGQTKNVVNHRHGWRAGRPSILLWKSLALLGTGVQCRGGAGNWTVSDNNRYPRTLIWPGLELFFPAAGQPHLLLSLRCWLLCRSHRLSTWLAGWQGLACSLEGTGLWHGLHTVLGMGRWCSPKPWGCPIEREVIPGIRKTQSLGDKVQWAPWSKRRLQLEPWRGCREGCRGIRITVYPKRGHVGSLGCLLPQVGAAQPTSLVRSPLVGS